MSTGCCPHYHEAVELIGRRWTGAILAVLLDGQALRFSELAGAVPELSDRMLSDRLKELEARGLVERTVHAGRPLRVEYALTRMGFALGPAVGELHVWAQRWLAVFEPASAPRTSQPVARGPAAPSLPIRRDAASQAARRPVARR
jgi:DNA-binding HxlR family transcriptional regulator